jgi:DNA-binding NarL/FixJ family response regulator
MKEESYLVLLAGSQALFREDLRRMIVENPYMDVIGEVSDGLQIPAVLNRLSPQLIILDTSLPNLRAMETTRQIKTIRPGIKVLILGTHGEKEYLDGALSAGADGYLLKEDAYGEILSAIDIIRQGKLYVSSRFSK